jgi:hypothetical protein
MKTIAFDIKTVATSVIFDVLAVAFIFLLPAFSHLLAFPLYLLDPMRIALILSIVYTNRKNAYLIAFLLPVVSFIISSHPLLYKVMLISGELMVNAFLFYFLMNRTGKVFVSAIISIVASKVLYYTAKFAIILLAIEKAELVATPLYIQGIVAVVLSLFMALFLKGQVVNKKNND